MISPLLDTILDSIDDAVIVTDGVTRILRVNTALETALSITARQLTGPEAASFVPMVLTPGFQAGIASASRNADGWSGNCACRCGDGQTRSFNVSIRHSGQDDLFVAVLRDRSGETVGVDSLTGLPNRFLFADRVAQQILNARRVDKSVSVLIMGLDRFTRVNDALGHAFGDRVLQQVSQRLQQVIRQSDTGARLDGDKFAVATPIASANDSVIVAEKVLKAIQEPFQIDGQEVVVTFSIGISVFPDDGETADDLVKHADSALHHAKSSGRNQYQFYANEMNTRAQNRLKLERDMRRALAGEEFLLYYQPKVDIESDGIIGMEALIRWRDPVRGMVSPGEFIPVAEETGMIEEIGNWVLRDACRRNKAWQHAGLKPVRVSVNISAHQFRSRHMVERVVQALDESGLDPRWLELEITESMLMNNVDEAVAKMQALRDLGLHLSIDDFGTGYSSLSYLGRFPITTLKIDRAFIHDVETNASTAEIARAIIGLSRGLSLEVVAEGAELAEQVQFLREHGCDVVQGFFYSRPLPPEEFEALLRKDSGRTGWGG